MSKPRLAILGAGPIGLEAALYARELQLPFTVYERGRPGEHVRRWGHVRLFSPFAMNATLLGRKVVAVKRDVPADDAILTGREHVDQYLAPLAETLGGQLKTESQVLYIGRRGFFKHESPGDPSRGKQPFLLLVRDKTQERVDEADIVLDCTGTYAQHRWLGSGGIPAPGELLTEPRIAYGLEDVLGDKQKDYANRSILLVGSGYSAASTACNLATLAEKNQSTWITWLTRAGHTQPLRRIPNDPLRERDRLAARANNLATRPEGNIEFFSQAVVEKIEPLQESFRVICRVAGQPRTWEVERIVANVGYTPDRILYRELQMHECYASLGPMKLAAALMGQKNADCTRLTATGADSLRNPEPNFYVLGAKSFGRNSLFLLRLGFEQVRDVFTLIVGDARLDLYKK